MMMIMTLSLPFNYLVGTGFGRSCDHWASENEKKNCPAGKSTFPGRQVSTLFAQTVWIFLPSTKS